MNEKLLKPTCYAVLAALGAEVLSLRHHYEQNVGCRPPAEQAGCLPAVPDWLLPPHVERNHSTSSAVAGFLVAGSTATSTATVASLDDIVWNVDDYMRSS